MTNHFEFEEFDEHSSIVESPCSEIRETGSELAPTSCTSQRDRFELLSAYLDGEVTASERRQVESWLATDAKTQCLYSRLLTLRQGLQTLPIVKSEQSVEQFVDQMTARLNHQPRRLDLGRFGSRSDVSRCYLHSRPARSLCSFDC